MVRMESQSWFYNGMFAIYFVQNVVFYGSYTRGFEEFGIVFENVANRGEVLFVSFT